MDKATHKPLAITKVDLLVRGAAGFEVVASVLTDTTGSFMFQNLYPRQYAVSAFYKMKSGTTYLPVHIADGLGRNEIDSNINVLAGKNYHTVFYLMVTCPYEKTKHMDCCPNCNKKDKVKPILWGLPSVDVNGNWVVKGKDRNEYYMGGCSPDIWCNPSKHCERCKIDF
ncbi:hypothetical protein [Foetidibacter luteolus]|uniref:hypothetical protein n=1 Tax=Foetidibacter luteolus TaxID=2608880 RepID=UPI00129AD5BF|nr:hypothetical protein [Foetidibacter luteolus]